MPTPRRSKGRTPGDRERQLARLDTFLEEHELPLPTGPGPLARQATVERQRREHEAHYAPGRAWPEGYTPADIGVA
jgi:hypothetical protein